MIYLVSFPRSGSHWLRTILSLGGYPIRSGLVHSHDNDLNYSPPAKSGDQVVYLYREPLGVMFSMSEYYRTYKGRNPRHWPEEPTEAEPRLRLWMKKWNQHIRRWTSGSCQSRVTLYVRYRDVPEGGEVLLRSCGYSTDNGPRHVDRKAVRSEIRKQMRPRAPLDVDRVLEEPDAARSSRKLQFIEEFAPVIFDLSDFQSDHLPPTGLAQTARQLKD